MDYYGPNFLLMIVVWSTMIYSWEAMAELLSVAFPNPLLGMMQFMGLWFSGFLCQSFCLSMHASPSTLRPLLLWLTTK